MHFVLDWLERHSSSNLSAYLTMGVSATELAKEGYGYVDEGGWPEITYQFLQWGLDSESMLIYYVLIEEPKKKKKAAAAVEEQGN